MIKIRKGLEQIIKTAKEDSIFATEGYKGQTDNKLFESYLLLLADNYYEGDVQALINKHKIQFDGLSSKLEAELNLCSIPDETPLFYSIYLEGKKSVVNKMYSALSSTQILLRELYPEIDFSNTNLAKDSRMKPWFEMNLLGFVYDGKMKEQEDHNKILTSDDPEVVRRKHTNLIQRMFE